MKRGRKARVIQSVCCLVVVIAVIAISFLLKEEIERFAATGYFGVFASCFAATSTILLPAPGILVVIRYACLLNPLLVILAGGAGTATGELVGYIFGRSGNEIVRISTTGAAFRFFEKYPRLMIFLFSLIPLPVFDIVGICAGMTKMNLFSFFISCLAGKTIKMGAYVVFFYYATEYFPKIIAM